VRGPRTLDVRKEGVKCFLQEEGRHSSHRHAAVRDLRLAQALDLVHALRSGRCVQRARVSCDRGWSARETLAAGVLAATMNSGRACPSVKPNGSQNPSVGTLPGSVRASARASRKPKAHQHWSAKVMHTWRCTHGDGTRGAQRLATSSSGRMTSLNTGTEVQIRTHRGVRDVLQSLPACNDHRMRAHRG
jgi:hypothetical protein